MALTDTFFRRYSEPIVRRGRSLPDGFLEFFKQVAHVFAQDIQPRVQQPHLYFGSVHDKLARELSLPRLANGSSELDAVLRFLTGATDYEDRMSPDIFVKTRLSLLEIALADLEEMIRKADQPPVPSHEIKNPVALFASGPETAFVWSSNLKGLRQAIVEVNERFRLNGLKFHYHNGLIQEIGDELVAEVVEEPFWSLTAGALWSSVDLEMKEAIDRRDQGKNDASFHALRALESALKILSDQKGLTTGKEKGAVNYIENLSSRRGGQWLASWEAGQLKSLFGDVRNPQGHGAGSGKPLLLSPHQTAFVVECAMSWIKSLITRP